MLEAAFAEMLADPERFLRHYLVMIAGSSPSKPPLVLQQQATFRMRAGDVTVQGFQTGFSGMRGLTKKRTQLRIETVPDGTTARADQLVFQAWYIPMTEIAPKTETSDGGSRGALAHHVTLRGHGGPDIALTSQMSGCTLGIGSPTKDGSRFVAHIRSPSGQQPDAKTRENMRNAASLGTMDAFFERTSQSGDDHSYANPRNRATIIGVRRANQWRFYAQTYDIHVGRLYKVDRL